MKCTYCWQDLLTWTDPQLEGWTAEGMYMTDCNSVMSAGSQQIFIFWICLKGLMVLRLKLRYTHPRSPPLHRVVEGWWCWLQNAEVEEKMLRFVEDWQGRRWVADEVKQFGEKSDRVEAEMVVCDGEMMDILGKRCWRWKRAAKRKRERPNRRFLDVAEEPRQEENESWYKQLNVEHDVTVGNSWFLFGDYFNLPKNNCCGL